MRAAIELTPLHIPITLQSFRVLVELLIYYTYLEGIFPQRATFVGLNFDVLSGITAVFVVIAVFKGVMKSRGMLLWNLASLCILLVVVYSFISSYYFSDFLALGYKFAEFPYLLLASVLLPVAIFLHVFSIKQLLVRQEG